LSNSLSSNDRRSHSGRVEIPSVTPTTKEVRIMEQIVRPINYAIVERAESSSEPRSVAMRLARPLIDQGDASTQWFLGHLQQTRGGRNSNMREAVNWYQKAAAQGFARAEYALRVMQERGLNWYAEDCQRFFKREPTSDAFDARYMMPGCSRRDCGRALKWYCDAAEKSDGEIQILLGMIYERAIGVRRNVPEALKWYRMGSEFGLAEAHTLFEKLYQSELRDFRIRSSYERREAKEKYLVARSRRRLGRAPPNEVEAFEWYRKLAEAGDADAQVELGKCYIRGQGVRRNRTLGYMWVFVACERHPDEAVREVLDHWRGMSTLSWSQSKHDKMERMASQWIEGMPRGDAP
jgi:uncharacterized protein